MMPNVRFGRSGLTITPITLGTMNFGNQLDEDASRAILDRALDLGIRTLDTANCYPIGDRTRFGATEEIIGRWLRGRRDEVIIATKCGMPTGRQAWESGASRKNIMTSVEKSLRRLQTDYVDVLQMHAWDPATPLDETLSAFDDLVRRGLVRYAGVANYRPHQVARTVGRAETLGTAGIHSVQWRYNLLYREAEHDLAGLCQAEGLALLVYNPLGGGMLTGKHARGEVTPGGRFSHGTSAAVYAQRYWHEEAFQLVDGLREVAEQASMSPATLALQWVLSHPFVTSVLAGASRPEQLDDAVAALAPADPEAMARLDELSEPFAERVDLSWREGPGAHLPTAHARAENRPGVPTPAT